MKVKVDIPNYEVTVTLNMDRNELAMLKHLCEHDVSVPRVLYPECDPSGYYAMQKFLQAINRELP